MLGLFYTPLALASVYYFLPKVIGRPTQSYNLSLLGFWGLAFFYGQVGGHHLIDGPVPGWLVTLSIAQRLMMMLPVLAFTINQCQTLKGHFGALRHSPTLRFIGVGGLANTFSLLQNSIEALRSVNVVTHFTHWCCTCSSSFRACWSAVGRWRVSPCASGRNCRNDSIRGVSLAQSRSPA